MKWTSLAALGLALAGTAACNKGSDSDAEKFKPAAPVEAVAPPAGQSWSQVVSATPAGGFVMGNPNAAVKLVEFGSMTCPHCREFDEQGAKALIENYVNTGKVSWEFRNFIRDPYDVAASLVARCGGAASFFGMTRGLYAEQVQWVERLQAMPPEQSQALQGMSPQQQFTIIAQTAGFDQFAAKRGLAKAKLDACLANQAEATRLVQMQGDAVADFNIPGTPAFLINNVLVEDAAAWEALEPKLKAAIGG